MQIKPNLNTPVCSCYSCSEAKKELEKQGLINADAELLIQERVPNALSTIHHIAEAQDFHKEMFFMRITKSDKLKSISQNLKRLRQFIEKQR
jgi:hypothetical protein